MESITSLKNGNTTSSNSFEYNYFENPDEILKNIQYLTDFEIDETNVIQGAKDILKIIRPNWNLNNVHFKFFTVGITNKLIGCYINGTSTSGGDVDKCPIIEHEDVVLVRIYGRNTEALIDRKEEIINFRTLIKKKFAPALYAVFKNGFAYEYIHGVTLTSDNVIQPNISKLIAIRMALMHKMKLNDNSEMEAIDSSGNCCSSSSRRNGDKLVPFLWSKTQTFLELIPKKYNDDAKNERFQKKFPSIEQLREEFQNLYNHLEKLDSPIVFAHNDLLLANIIYTESLNRILFIDYEYSGKNFQAYEIGNFFAEFCGVNTVDYTKYPNKEFQMNWLRIYLEIYLNTKNVKLNDIEHLYVQVNKFTLAAHFFWAMWALIQSDYSLIDFDFLSYAEIRYTEYLARKDEFLALKFPNEN